MKTKPIAFFDLETTGLEITTARIVSISICTFTFGDEITFSEFYSLVNPGIPIPAEVTEIHGISNDDVSNSPVFAEIATEVLTRISGSDIGGYNILNYDLPVLMEELHRVFSPKTLIEFYNSKPRIIDVCAIYKKLHTRKLNDAYREYCGMEMEDNYNAHNARDDVMATVDVFRKMLERHEELDSIDKIQEMSSYGNKIVDFAQKLGVDADGDYIYCIGRAKGVKIKDDRGFGEWMLKQDFSADTKLKLSMILKSLK